jgi:hypothetical protein
VGLVKERILRGGSGVNRLTEFAPGT